MARRARQRRVKKTPEVPQGPMREDIDAILLKRTVIYTHELIEHYVSFLLLLGRNPKHCPVLGATASRTNEAKPALFQPEMSALGEARAVLHEASRLTLQMATLIECATPAKAGHVALFRWAQTSAEMLARAIDARALTN